MDYVTLNDGNKMPQLGLGVYQVTDLNVAKQTVKDGLALGYRLLDTAIMYGNETAVGDAMAESGVARDDIFVTTKLWMSDYDFESATQNIDQSLKNLKTDYIDLYLLHQPYGDIAGAWRALINAQKAGKIRSIGVSNFADFQVKDLELMSGVKPAVNQIELSPWYQRNTNVAFLQGDDVQVEAWAPFAEGQHDIFTNEVIKQIADKYHKSNAQVILRWILQRGIVVIPKSVHKNRLAQNIDVFDFSLTDEEMKVMATLDRGESQFFSHQDPAKIEQIFGSSLAQLQKTFQ